MWKCASLLLRNVKVALEMNARLLFLCIHGTMLVPRTQGKNLQYLKKRLKNSRWEAKRRIFVGVPQCRKCVWMRV